MIIMELQELLNKPLPQIPNELKVAISESKITKTPFECKNEILSNRDLQTEAGYIKMTDGTYLVSMVCPMPAITAEMIQWWFWWHAKDSLRYQVWYPGEHIGIKYHPKNKAYFEQPEIPAFSPNTHCPVERIGGITIPLRIDFVTPEEFGFSRQIMKDNNIPEIVCGHVGAFNNIVRHTEMAHIFKQTDNGLFMISRFWLGNLIKNPLLRKLIITENMAKGMAEHCAVEYRNLCEILPILYEDNR